jgi:hypothetical protein
MRGAVVLEILGKEVGTAVMVSELSYRSAF